MYGNCRRRAVEKAVEWFSKDFKGVLGHAHKVMTIGDPFEEVTYNEEFACNDLGNKYLDDITIDRVLAESGGDLVREDPESDNVQHNSLRRVRRRRKVNVQLTTRLSQTSSGTIYYRMSEPVGKKGNRMKSKSVKLTSKSLEKALREVSRRGLDKFEHFEDEKFTSKIKTTASKQAS